MAPLRRLLPALALILAGATACSAVTPAAAVVNGKKIRESEVQEELDRSRDDPNFQELIRRQGDAGRGVVRRNVLSTLIRLAVIEQEARRRGIRATPTKISAFLRDLQAQLGGAEQFAERLREANLTLDRARIIAQRLVYERDLKEEITKDVQVAPDEVRQLYDANARAFTEVHLLGMTLPTEAEATRAADDLAKGADFATLARERSRDEAAQNGGDLGFVPAARVGGAVQAAIEALEPGGVTAPQRAQTGFQIFKLVERRVRAFEEVRDDIAQRLVEQAREQRFADWEQGRLRRARIVVNPKYGRFDREDLEVVGGSARLRP